MVTLSDVTTAASLPLGGGPPKGMLCVCECEFVLLGYISDNCVSIHGRVGVEKMERRQFHGI